jgi:hypothetical protein
MLDLMAVTSGNQLPLYLHVASRILRDLRVVQQQKNTSFDYSEFKRLLDAENLTKEQMAPLKQRLDTLESFMVESQAKAYSMSNQDKKVQKKKSTPQKSTDWTPKASTPP